MGVQLGFWDQVLESRSGLGVTVGFQDYGRGQVSVSGSRSIFGMGFEQGFIFSGSG